MQQGNPFNARYPETPNAPFVLSRYLEMIHLLSALFCVEKETRNEQMIAE